MTEPTDQPKEPKKSGFSFGPAYDSIHADDTPRIAGSPARIDWRLPLIVLPLLAIIFFAVVNAFEKAEPSDRWLDLQSLHVHSDEAYLYLRITTRGTKDRPDWRKVAYRVAFDTYDAERGETRLPPPLTARLPTGVEFLLELQGPGSRLLVTPPYDPYREEAWGDLEPVQSPREATGRFTALRFEANPRRFTRAGEEIPPRYVDRGTLRWGSLDPASASYDTLSDATTGAGVIEVRIPWGLLNVADPSSLQVLHSVNPGRDQAATVRTNGFRIYVLSFDPSEEGDDPADALPDFGDVPDVYRWEPWESPVYEIRRKDGWNRIRETLETLPDFVEDEDAGRPAEPPAVSDGTDTLS